MNKVKITCRDSCKTYALRRAGLEGLIDWSKDAPTIKEMCESDLFEHLDKPEIGSIIIWLGKGKKSTKGYFKEHEIDELARIFSTKIFDYGHCAVYEEYDIVSEAIMEGKQGIRIRIRSLKELPKPDFILKIKCLTKFNKTQI